MLPNESKNGNIPDPLVPYATPCKWPCPHAGKCPNIGLSMDTARAIADIIEATRKIAKPTATIAKALAALDESLEP